MWPLTTLLYCKCQLVFAGRTGFVCVCACVVGAHCQLPFLAVVGIQCVHYTLQMPRFSHARLPLTNLDGRTLAVAMHIEDYNTCWSMHCIYSITTVLLFLCRSWIPLTRAAIIILQRVAKTVIVHAQGSVLLKVLCCYFDNIFSSVNWKLIASPHTLIISSLLSVTILSDLPVGCPKHPMEIIPNTKTTI